MEIEGWKSIVDLIILEMQEFNAIVGMDWLRKNKAKNDCYGKQITVRPTGQAEIIYHGNTRGYHGILVAGLVKGEGNL